MKRDGSQAGKEEKRWERIERQKGVGKKAQVVDEERWQKNERKETVEEELKREPAFPTILSTE